MTTPTPGADRGGPSTRLRLGILFFTVLVDLVGFGIILPILPFYADRFGASGLQIGLLVLSYSAAQLLVAPLWGRLSDRFGRRPILLVGLLGSVASYLVFAFADSIAMLLLSRTLAGLMGANLPVAQAYIADITKPGERAGAMGLIGAAFGLGFIFGPAIGGVLAPIAPEAPGLAAAALCLINTGLAFFLLPESLDPDERTERALRRPAAAIRTRIEEARLTFGNPRFLQILALTFLFTLAFSTIHPTFSLYAQRLFGMDERDVGWVFAFMGLVSAIMQGGVVRAVAPRIGEAALVRISSVFFAGGLWLIAVAPSVGMLYLGVGTLAIGFGGTLPALVSLLSREAPEELQGGSLGVGQSVGSLGRIGGPLLAGFLWDTAGMSWPYLAGAGIAAVAGIWALGLRQPRSGHG